jgi:hypothetical protein
VLLRGFCCPFEFRDARLDILYFDRLSGMLKMLSVALTRTEAGAAGSTLKASDGLTECLAPCIPVRFLKLRNLKPALEGAVPIPAAWAASSTLRLVGRVMTKRESWRLTRPAITEPKQAQSTWGFFGWG